MCRYSIETTLVQRSSSVCASNVFDIPWPLYVVIVLYALMRMHSPINGSLFINQKGYKHSDVPIIRPGEGAAVMEELYI